MKKQSMIMHILLALCFAFIGNAKAQTVDYQSIIKDMIAKQPIWIGDYRGPAEFHIQDLYELYSENSEDNFIDKRKTKRFAEGKIDAFYLLGAAGLSIAAGLNEQQKLKEYQGPVTQQSAAMTEKINNRSELYFMIALPLTMAGSLSAIRQHQRWTNVKQTIEKLKEVFSEKTANMSQHESSRDMLQTIILKRLNRQSTHSLIDTMLDNNSPERANANVKLQIEVSDTILQTLIGVSSIVSIDEEKDDAELRVQHIKDRTNN